MRRGEHSYLPPPQPPPAAAWRSKQQLWWRRLIQIIRCREGPLGSHSLCFLCILGPNKQSKHRYFSSLLLLMREVGGLRSGGGSGGGGSPQEAAGQSLNNKWVFPRIWLIISGRRHPGTSGLISWKARVGGGPALEPQTLINGRRKWKAAVNNFIIKVPLGGKKSIISAAIAINLELSEASRSTGDSSEPLHHRVPKKHWTPLCCLDPDKGGPPADPRSNGDPSLGAAKTCKPRAPRGSKPTFGFTLDNSRETQFRLWASNAAATSN